MTRVRVLTARGPGAIAVVRVEGPDARERVGRLARPAPASVGGMRLVRLAFRGEDLDQALVATLGEETLELHLHGSPPLVERVLAALAAAPETPGDIDAPLSLEERAARAVGRAPSRLGARVLLDQADGALRRAVEALSDARGETFERSLAELIERGRVARHLLRPTLVVLAGPVNAGKSTLFNALVGEHRVLVSPERGTTRDLIRERTTFGPWPVDLVDTAGERELGPLAEQGPAARVESEGQEQARALVAAADVCFWLAPLSPEGASISVPGWVGARAGWVGARDGKTLLIRSLADLHSGTAPLPEPSVAAGPDPRQARATIEHLFMQTLRLTPNPWRPGAGAPFEASQLHALAGLARGSKGPARRRVLEALLAPSSTEDELAD